jgi:hypothetical protein
MTPATDKEERMPVCPHCGVECQAGLVVCPACGGPLVEQPRREPWRDAGEVIPVVVAIAQGLLEAELIRSKLDSEGIATMLQYDTMSSMGLTVDGLGAVRILVPAPLARDARAVLRAIGVPPVGGEGDDAPAPG